MLNFNRDHIVPDYSNPIDFSKIPAEVKLVTFAGDGLIEPELADPKSIFWVGVRMKRVHFHRAAAYTVTRNSRDRTVWEVMGGTVDTVWLLEDAGSFYCVAEPMGVFNLFGKLDQDSALHKQALKWVRQYLKDVRWGSGGNRQTQKS